MQYAVTRSIDAPPETVWALLVDVPSWKEWNPTIVEIDGTAEVGSKVSLVSTVNPDRTFKLTVKSVEPPSRMVWADGMPLGLFTGERTYTVTPSGGGCEFSMVETYTGLLAPLITKAIPDMTESFEQFADGLVAAAESR